MKRSLEYAALAFAVALVLILSTCGGPPTAPEDCPAGTVWTPVYHAHGDYVMICMVPK